MSDTLITPEFHVEIDSIRYTLDCTFKTLKAIQHATEIEILRFIAQDLASYPFDDLAKVIRIGIALNPPALETIERAIVDDIGITEARFLVMSWLAVATSPKAQRQKKADEFAAIRQKLKASPGATTSESRPAS